MPRRAGAMPPPSAPAVLRLLAAAALPARRAGIIVRDDRPDAAYVADPSAFPSVFPFHAADPAAAVGECAATVALDARHAVTAAHCLSSNKALRPFAVTIGGRAHTVTEVALDPCWEWDPDDPSEGGPNGHDVAVLTIDPAVGPGVPVVPIYGALDEVGRTFTLVGWGDTGAAGVAAADVRRDGRLRAAANVFTAAPLTGAAAGTLTYTFDDPAGGRALATEGLAYSGDSGGPAFIDDGGVRMLAGVNSGGGCCGYGSVDQYSRLSAKWANGWLRSMHHGERRACASFPGFGAGAAAAATPVPPAPVRVYCALSGGGTVADGWSGRDTGANSCNTCSCANGALACTKMACAGAAPPPAAPTAYPQLPAAALPPPPLPAPAGNRPPTASVAVSVVDVAASTQPFFAAGVLVGVSAPEAGQAVAASCATSRPGLAYGPMVDIAGGRGTLSATAPAPGRYPVMCVLSDDGVPPRAVTVDFVIRVVDAAPTPAPPARTAAGALRTPAPGGGDDDSSMPVWAIVLVAVIPALCCLLLVAAACYARRRGGDGRKRKAKGAGAQPAASARGRAGSPGADEGHDYSRSGGSYYESSAGGAVVGRYAPGTQVHALYLDGKWYEATVREVGADGRYTIEWYDGSFSGDVPHDQLATRDGRR